MKRPIAHALRRAHLRAGVLVLAIVAALACPQGEAAPHQNAKPVEFRFSWQEGMRVPIRLTFTQRYPGQPVQVARFQATLAVDSVERNLRLSFADSKVEADLPNRPVSDLALVGIHQQLRFLSVPDFFVSPGGRYVAVANDQHVRSVLQDVFGNSGIKALTPEQVDRSVHASAQSRARSLWNEWVTYWAGLSVKPQTLYDAEHRVTTVMPNSPMLIMHSQFEIGRDRPCRRENRVRTCVTISASEAPQAADLAAWREQLIANWLSKVPAARRAEDEAAMRSEMGSATMEFSQTMKYVVEPAGLIPHSVTVTKVGDMTGQRERPGSGHIEWELKSEFEY